MQGPSRHLYSPPTHSHASAKHIKVWFEHVSAKIHWAFCKHTLQAKLFSAKHFNIFVYMRCSLNTLRYSFAAKHIQICFTRVLKTDKSKSSNNMNLNKYPWIMLKNCCDIDTYCLTLPTKRNELNTIQFFNCIDRYVLQIKIYKTAFFSCTCHLSKSLGVTVWYIHTYL